MKNFLAKKGLGWYFTAVAVILNLLGVILYGVSRENTSSAIIVLLVFAMATGVAVALKHFKFTEYVPFILSVIPFALTVAILLENVTQIWFKNNVVGLSSTIIPAVVFMALATILSACAVVSKHEKD